MFALKLRKFVIIKIIVRIKMVNFLFVVDNSYSTDLNVFLKLCFQRF